jgi:hypothetical protein
LQACGLALPGSDLDVVVLGVLPPGQPVHILMDLFF